MGVGKIISFFSDAEGTVIFILFPAQLINGCQVGNLKKLLVNEGLLVVP